MFKSDTIKKDVSYYLSMTATLNCQQIKFTIRIHKPGGLEHE